MKNNTLYIHDLSGFYNFIAENEVNKNNMFVYYTGKLSKQIKYRMTNVKYIYMEMNNNDDNMVCDNLYKILCDFISQLEKVKDVSDMTYDMIIDSKIRLYFYNNNFIDKYNLNLYICDYYNKKLGSEKINCNNDDMNHRQLNDNNLSEINIYNLRKINFYGTEDLTHITDEDYIYYLCNKHNGFVEYIEKIYFSKEKPENHNICIPKINLDYIAVYQKNQWNICDKNECITILLFNKL